MRGTGADVCAKAGSGISGDWGSVRHDVLGPGEWDKRVAGGDCGGQSQVSERLKTSSARAIGLNLFFES